MNQAPDSPVIVGRYALSAEIASGGMATIHIGRLLGPVGFSRTVAIKRLHPQYARDPEFVAMFMDEARLAARIRHPNVVSILDMAAVNGELLLVMDYIGGESLSSLLRRERKHGRVVAVDVAVRIVLDLLSGLHAAHEAKNERGEPLRIVHRDVSPQNVLVGENGVSHLIDFGVAKAIERVQTTTDGQLKGKLCYMAPEQFRGGPVTRRVDVYAAGIVLWEILVGRRVFDGADARVMYDVLSTEIPRPGTLTAGIPRGVDAVVMRAVSKDPTVRFETAAEMADALEDALTPATPRQVARWLQSVAAGSLERKARLVSAVEGLHAPSEVSGRPELSSLSEVSDLVQPVTVAAPPSYAQAAADSSREAISTGGSAYTGPGAASHEVPSRTRAKRRWVFGILALGAGLALTVVLSIAAGGRSDSGAPADEHTTHQQDAQLVPSAAAPSTSTAVSPAASDSAPSTSADLADAEPAASAAVASAVPSVPPPVTTKPAAVTQPTPAAPQPRVPTELERRREQRRKERGW